MHSDPTELLANHLALSGVNTGANVNAESLDRIHNCPSAADRARRTIKRRQEAVARSIDFSAAMPRELVTNKGVMLHEEVFPSAVTEFDKPVASTMSVNSMVASTRSLSVSISRRWPVRKDSISPRIEFESPTHGQ
jgi:hypothetical protein